MYLDTPTAAARLCAAHPAQHLFGRADLLQLRTITDDTHTFLTRYMEREFDFIYDLRSGLFLMELSGRHALLMAALHEHWTGEHLEMWEASDRYITDTLGIFKSRAAPWVFHGINFDLPSALLPLARDLRPLP